MKSPVKPPEQKVLAEELHKPVRRKFQTRRTITNYINDLWQIDIVDLQKLAHYNKGFKYYLAVIDTFSKVGYAEPLKTKSKTEVATAFEKILKESSRQPKNLQSDEGTEFYNRDFNALMKKYNINHYHTYSDKKAAIVERWNRTIKNNLYKKFTEYNTLNWINMIQQVVKDYNNTKHSSIGIAPSKVNESNSDQVRIRLATCKTSIVKPKFKIGDWVRITKYKHIFEKGYTINWSEELYKVVRVRKTVPIVYELETELGEQVKGTFYEKEMMKTKIPDYFRIDKVLQKRTNKDGTVELKVTKKGHNPKFYYWIPMSETDKL